MGKQFDDNTDWLPTSADEGEALPELWLRISAFLSLKSKTTQITYSGILKEWCHFLGITPGSREGAQLFAAAEDIQAIAYRAWLERQPGQRPRLKRSPSNQQHLQVGLGSREARDGLQSTQTNATIAKKFAALRRIYRMLQGSNLSSPKNPFDIDAVPAPSGRSGRKRPTEMVQFERVKEVLDLPDPTTPKGIRDRALLAALFGGGLRRSEVAKLRIGDVKLTRKGTSFLSLRATKSRQDTDQAIPEWAAERIRELITLRASQGAAAGDVLFPSFRGRAQEVPANIAISHDGIYRLFKSYCLRAGIFHATPHSARATAITKLLDQGISFREVQEFSRHASVQMVEVYDKRRISVDENPAKDLDFE